MLQHIKSEVLHLKVVELSIFLTQPFLNKGERSSVPPSPIQDILDKKKEIQFLKPGLYRGLSTKDETSETAVVQNLLNLSSYILPCSVNLF